EAGDRQARPKVDPRLSDHGWAGGWAGRSDGGGYAARRAALSAAVEPDARRAGQGIGDARPQLRAVCRRLQHLRAQSAGRRAGDGRRRRVPDQAPQAEGQQGEECGRPAEQAQVPGLQLHDWETAPAAQSAGSPHGPWRLSNSPALAIALPNAFFVSLRLASVAVRPEPSSIEPPCTDPYARWCGRGRPRG